MSGIGDVLTAKDFRDAFQDMAGDPVTGYYRRRLYSRGPWIPVRIWWEIGDIEPETGDHLSDDILHGEENTNLHDPLAWRRIDPWRAWGYIHPIMKDEFQWMILLKTVK